MRSELDVLLDKVEDPTLRADLQSQIERIQTKRSFGLVFESHLPERVRLHDHSIRRGLKVAFRDQPDSPAFEVLGIESTTVKMRKVRNPDGSALSPDEASKVIDESAPIDDLIVIADFGEPVFPGLCHLGSIKRGGDDASHLVIKGENHHVLEALQFSHAGKVDCIYIDPPYNSGGARDWKYDNNYVDKDDTYRHSKWLAFMERRLVLAKQLLRPDDSVLIVAVDENELPRLLLLLDQTFPSSKVQMVTVLINPAGASIIDQFSRVDEQLLFVHIGAARPIRTIADTTPLHFTKGEGNGEPAKPTPRKFSWESMQRRGGNSRREDTKAKFFPIYINEVEGRIVGCGDHLPLGEDRSTVSPPPTGCLQQWPIKQDGSEACWQLSAPTFRKYLERGRIRLGRKKRGGAWGIAFLTKGHMTAIAEGELVVRGRDKHGALIVQIAEGRTRSGVGKTMWINGSYSATEHGSTLLRKFIPGRKFPFPKSLYAVEDALRFYIGNKPEAVVLDFFAGSGTTTHAVARLNHQDGGRRQSICVTNNEVAAAEAEAFREQGLRPGDPDWEARGIFEHITRPRLEAAITGKTPEGDQIEGNYRFVDEFPMGDGIPENLSFFEMTYLDAEQIELDLSFSAIAPLLWLRAGARGLILEERLDSAGLRKPYEWTEQYGVLFNPDRWRSFVDEVPSTATTAFVVTDSASTFAGVASELPTSLDVVRLYDNYLTTFAINGGL